MCVGGLVAGIGSAVDIQGQSNEWQLKDRESAANIRLTRQAKADAEARGSRDVGAVRQKGSTLIEQQKVAYAASGVDPTQGTAANVMADTKMVSELDAQTVSNNAAREAWGFETKGEQIKSQRELDKIAHRNKATNTALTGVGRVVGGMGGAMGGG